MLWGFTELKHLFPFISIYNKNNWNGYCRWHCRFQGVCLWALGCLDAPQLKGYIFLKNRHFIILERFNKLIYRIYTIIKCATWDSLKFKFVSRFWNKMIFFYHISELMLPTLIQRYDKNHFIFDPVPKKKKKKKKKIYRLSDATFDDGINTIYQVMRLSWIKNKKKSIFEEYGAFKFGHFCCLI